MENDVYNNQAKYERYKTNLLEFAIPPEKRSNPSKRYAGKYYCKNESKLQHFKTMFKKFETKDPGYIRRLRVPSTLKLITRTNTKKHTL